MTKFCTLLICMLCYFPIFAQTFTESFETDGEGTRYESNNFTSTCNADFFRRMQDGECPTNANANFRDLATNNAIGEDGTFYFAGSDVDQGAAGENPLGTGENAYLVMQTVAITGGANTFQIVVKLAAEDDNNQHEGEERIFIEYAFDGDIATGANCNNCLPSENNVNSGSYTTIGAFIGNTTIDLYQEDTDLNGVPDGSTLSGTFVDYTYTITSVGNPTNLSIRIQLINQASSEDGAFDHIRLTSSFVLPVELTDFKATAKEKDVFLEWNTETELNNEGFEIERSIDGEAWNKIGFVRGNGSVQTPQRYQFIDADLDAKMAYYRLKQIDFDGETSYSNMVSVEMKDDKTFEVFPNPVTNILNLRGELALKEDAHIVIMNNVGGKVIEVQSNSSTIDISNLTPGLYFIQIHSGHMNRVRSFVKK
ncbi:MAG: T9SS type A sorting domain-containing protein [Saprospiraceae bacterium]